MIADWFGRSPELYLAWGLLIVGFGLFFYWLKCKLDQFGDWVASRRQPPVAAPGLRSSRQQLDAVVRISDRRATR